MAGIENKKGQDILMNVVFAIQDNKDYLGDIDGLIGDGDHGAYMNKALLYLEQELKIARFLYLMDFRNLV